jgi:hypothetical protein
VRPKNRFSTCRNADRSGLMLGFLNAQARRHAMIVAELLIKRVISPSYVASCFDQFGPAAVIDGMMRQSAPCAANKAIRNFQARSPDADRIAWALLP